MPQKYMQNLRANFVSLVDKAANRREFLTRKDADGHAMETVQVPVFKRDDLSEDGVRYVTGVVYEPGVVDTQGDQMTAEEIAKAAHRYMRDAQGVDVQHSQKAEEGCWIAESTVHKSATIIGGQNVPEGAWTVTIGIEDPAIIAKVDNGELNGLSVGGFAQYVLKADMPPQIAGPGQPPQEGEQSMFKQLFTWLGEKLGLLKPTGAGVPQTPQAPSNATPMPPQAGPSQQPPQNASGNVQDAPGGGQNKPPQDAQKPMQEEGKPKMDNFNTELMALMQKYGMSAPTQKSEEPATVDFQAMIAKGVADGFAQAREAAKAAEAEAVQKSAEAKEQNKPAETVEKSADAPATVDITELAAVFKSAVGEVMAPMQETLSAIAKSHNLPTNGNGDAKPVSKSDNWEREILGL
ncbi:MAG: XkdF-like putative serine protease domain-containing protein [Muribaculaceae bacterium]|nr:XkdF-like putative serine protease domain-containing protein [Muribaculaceae bacterium]